MEGIVLMFVYVIIATSLWFYPVRLSRRELIC